MSGKALAGISFADASAARFLPLRRRILDSLG